MNAHIGASGVLRLNGQYLLGRREETDSSLPSEWCTPGGGIERGESIDECIVREFKEEVGLDVKVIEFGLFTSAQIRRSERHTTLLVFKLVKLVNPDAWRPLALEGFDEVGYFPFATIITSLRATLMTRAAISEFERWK